MVGKTTQFVSYATMNKASMQRLLLHKMSLDNHQLVVELDHHHRSAQTYRIQTTNVGEDGGEKKKKRSKEKEFDGI